MCTVSWLHQANGYEIFFNRDELSARQIAQPPRLAEYEGVNFIAPTDGDKGGTWLGVNEFGLTLALLNRYQDSYERARQYSSRGWLVRDLLPSHNDAAAARQLPEIDLTRFPPFTLLMLTPGHTRIAHWNSVELWWEADPAACMPLSSSSFRTPDVITARRKQFRQMAFGNELTPDILRRFHFSHEPAAGPFAICMHRDDAHTVSLSHLTVKAGVATFSYTAGSPCAEAGVETSFLTLRSSGGKHPVPEL